ncbi:MAG: DHA1 family bicyclomycin/chloramphenicol resistance-like MFS transporter [Moritella sp.]
MVIIWQINDINGFALKTYFLIPFLALLSALTPLAVGMCLPAMPSIADDFHVPIEIIQTTLSTYLFGFAIGQLFYGRKTVLVSGLVVYLVAAGLSLAHYPALP